MKKRALGIGILLFSVLVCSGCQKIRDTIGSLIGSEAPKQEPAKEEATEPTLQQEKIEKRVEASLKDLEEPAAETQEGKTAAPAGGLDRDAIHKVLDELVPRDGTRASAQTLEALSDVYAGIEMNNEVTVDKSVFVIYAGLQNKITLHVQQPAAIIIYHGNGNEFTVKKGAFEGEVLFILHGADMNTFHGADQMTVEAFRQE